MRRSLLRPSRSSRRPQRPAKTLPPGSACDHLPSDAAEAPGRCTRSFGPWGAAMSALEVGGSAQTRGPHLPKQGGHHRMFTKSLQCAIRVRPARPLRGGEAVTRVAREALCNRLAMVVAGEAAEENGTARLRRRGAPSPFSGTLPLNLMRDATRSPACHSVTPLVTK